MTVRLQLFPGSGMLVNDPSCIRSLSSSMVNLPRTVFAFGGR